MPYVRPTTIIINGVKYRASQNDDEISRPDFMHPGDYTVRFYCDRDNVWSPVVGYILLCPRYGQPRRFYECYSAAYFSLDEGFEQYIARGYTLRRVLSEMNDYLRRLNL